MKFGDRVNVSEIISHSSACADAHMKQMLWNCDKNKYSRVVYKTSAAIFTYIFCEIPLRVTDIGWK